VQQETILKTEEVLVEKTIPLKLASQETIQKELNRENSSQSADRS
jgi:hypothetical protein